MYKKSTPNSDNSSTLVTCRCKRIVVEYFVAVTPDGDEVEIRGKDKKDLKDGEELIGELNEDCIQQRYDNGEWSRSYTIEKWLDVSSK